MKKSLGNKRNELSEEHIQEITRLYGAFEHDAKSRFQSNGDEIERVCSKIFDNRDFGFLKLTIQRPLRLNFQASTERIVRLKEHPTYIGLAESSKRKNKAAIAREEEEGKQLQQDILDALSSLDADRLYDNRDEFVAALNNAIDFAGLRVPANVRKAILAALSERDPTADVCTDSKGDPEPDPELRDNESIPLPADIDLPLPIDYDKDSDNRQLVDLVRAHCDVYCEKEVKPHWPDAWIDYSKTRVGYEIAINRHFYVYEAPRPLEEIEADLRKIEDEIIGILKEVA